MARSIYELTDEELDAVIEAAETEKAARTIAYRRDVRNRKIEHKKNICHNRLGDWDYYKYDGQYSKGKILRSDTGHPVKKFYPSLVTEKAAYIAAMTLKEYLDEYPVEAPRDMQNIQLHSIIRW